MYIYGRCCAYHHSVFSDRATIFCEPGGVIRCESTLPVLHENVSATYVTMFHFSFYYGKVFTLADVIVSCPQDPWNDECFHYSWRVEWRTEKVLEEIPAFLKVIESKIVLIQLWEINELVKNIWRVTQNINLSDSENVTHSCDTYLGRKELFINLPRRYNIILSENTERWQRTVRSPILYYRTSMSWAFFGMRRNIILYLVVWGCVYIRWYQVDIMRGNSHAITARYH